VSREPVQLTAGAVSYRFPVPSKDGKTLFAVAGFKRAEIERYDAKAKVFQPFLSGISAQDISYSSDGQWIAYVSFPDGVLWRSKPDGTDRLQLSSPRFMRCRRDGPRTEVKSCFTTWNRASRHASLKSPPRAEGRNK
jgi:hypothetical protein